VQPGLDSLPAGAEWLGGASRTPAMQQTNFVQISVFDG